MTFPVRRGGLNLDTHCPTGPALAIDRLLGATGHLGHSLQPCELTSATQAPPPSAPGFATRTALPSSIRIRPYTRMGDS
ncbi:MAG: hypothetical protein ACRDRM_06835 [Pseudonocardiaceae bacterium]